MKYKAIFFDWGGVIGSDPDDNFLAKLLEDIGASSDQIEEILSTYKISFMRGEITEKEYWDALRIKYNLKIEDTISEEFIKWKGLKADQDILNLVKKAKSHGLKTAVLSNVIEPTYNVIKDAGYYNLFDDVIASTKVGYAKPDKEIYQIALDKLNVRAIESIFIDDKLKCIEPADEMGFKTILFKNKESLIDEINTLIENN